MSKHQITTAFIGMVAFVTTIFIIVPSAYADLATYPPSSITEYGTSSDSRIQGILIAIVAIVLICSILFAIVLLVTAKKNTDREKLLTPVQKTTTSMQPDQMGMIQPTLSAEDEFFEGIIPTSSSFERGEQYDNPGNGNI